MALVKRVAWEAAEVVYMHMKIEDQGQRDLHDHCLERIEALRRSLMVEAAWKLKARRLKSA